MNTSYANDPRAIGKYTSDTSLLVSNVSRNVNPFEKPLETNIHTSNPEILKIKPRQSVPELIPNIGTTVSKSCNLPGIHINRFENPHCYAQDPTHIIQDEDFRGGLPSRIVSKDTFFEENKNMFRK